MSWGFRGGSRWAKPFRRNTRKSLWHQFRGLLCLDERGQMAVELAVLMPVVLAVCVITTDMMVYLDACARFDRVAPEVVRYHASSPDASHYGTTAGIGAMQDDLVASMDAANCFSFQVSYGGGVFSSGAEQVPDALLSLVPQPQRYVCEMEYVPWPFTGAVFGVEPLHIEHVRTYVVDPYRPGAVI